MLVPVRNLLVGRETPSPTDLLNKDIYKATYFTCRGRVSFRVGWFSKSTTSSSLGSVHPSLLLYRCWLYQRKLATVVPEITSRPNNSQAKTREHHFQWLSLRSYKMFSKASHGSSKQWWLLDYYFYQLVQPSGEIIGKGKGQLNPVWSWDQLSWSLWLLGGVVDTLTKLGFWTQGPKEEAC